MDPSVRKMDYLFTPRSIAVIGASASFEKWGFGVISRLLEAKGDFKVYPVNPGAKEIMGVKAYPKVNDIPGNVDLAVIVIPPEYVPAAMADCASKDVKVVLVITAGFKEVGKEGTELETEMIRIARQAGIRVVGPNCNGHFNTGINLYTMGSSDIKPGPIGLISQSGNFGDFIVGQGTEKGIGFSKCVSSGNEADLTIEDYIEYLGDDPDTKVICAYVEGFKNGRRFFDLTREITKKKPIIIMKVGRTPEGANAAMSHTASLSGSDEIQDAIFRQTGVIRVGKVDEMLDVASALLFQPLPGGRRIGIATGGGGFGVVATDACKSMGLEIPPLSRSTIERLNRLMPPRWSHANPVDMAGDSYYAIPVLGSMLKASEVDAVLAVSCLGYYSESPKNFPSEIRDKLMRHHQEMADGELSAMEGLIERVHRYNKPLIIASVASPEQSRAIAKLAENHIFTYRYPEDGARILSYMVDYSEYLSKSRLEP